MCAQGDHPPYDIPEPQPPRRYVLAGDAPSREQIEQAYIDGSVEGSPIDRDGERRGSVAQAVLVEMLNETEWDQTVYPDEHMYIGIRLAILREARDRVAAAEARL
jgi:hypothetical protein